MKAPWNHPAFEFSMLVDAGLLCVEQLDESLTKRGIRAVLQRAILDPSLSAITTDDLELLYSRLFKMRMDHETQRSGPAYNAMLWLLAFLSALSDVKRAQAHLPLAPRDIFSHWYRDKFNTVLHFYDLRTHAFLSPHQIVYLEAKWRICDAVGHAFEPPMSLMEAFVAMWLAEEYEEAYATVRNSVVGDELV